MAAKRTLDDDSCFPAKKREKYSSCFASSSSYSTPPRWSYDVFLSFRGEDTRKSFTDHLYTALDRAGIRTFRDDDELRRGQDISSELPKSIKESRISIVVFSRNYSSSRWCLDELVKILECKKTLGQSVLPIFYNVGPSDVRHQTGCFAEAFATHEKCFVVEMKKVEGWRAALAEAANLSGWDLQNVADGYESKFIQKIVAEVLCIVKHTILHVAIHPVGIDSRVKVINGLLKIGSKDVHVIGIYGMGGIGKTTLANAVYNYIYLQFEGSCFLPNVREGARQLNGIVQLQKQLLSELLWIRNLDIDSVARGINLIKERLKSKRVLIVLDDLDQLSQLNSLAGGRDWFGSGSRIIITTRDEHLLKDLNVDERYMATKLNHVESLELFNWHAFGETNPSENYAKLANGIVNYAGGLPLALEVLGSSLFGRNVPEWNSAFEKLQQIPDDQIQNKLKISFDALDDDQKNIFLDIACFFIGMNRDYAITILDGCGFFSEIGISVLISRCLLRINKQNELRMHDLLRDMGREIIRKESPKKPGKRTRLWFHKDVCNVLEKNKGTRKVEGMSLALPMLKDIQTKAFASMPNLRLLQINNVHLSGNFEHLFEELRWLCWHNCSLEYLPSNLHLENLVALDMQFSRIKTFWQDGKSFKGLKILNLSNNKCLKKSPKFSALPSLEKLLLESCTSLIKLHESIGLLDRLVYLSLKNCMNFRYLPDSICKLKSIEHLNLTNCSKLEELPEHLGHMESLTELLADGTAIKQLPPSIVLLQNLTILSLDGCNRRLPTKSWLLSLSSSWASPRKNPDHIRFLPSSVSSLRSLTELTLSDCNLSEGDFPVDFGSLSSLLDLDLGRNNFRSLPCCFNHLSNLQYLRLNYCTSLQSISDLPPNLRNIQASWCASLEKISNPKYRRLLLMSASMELESPVRGSISESPVYLVSFPEESELLLFANCNRWKDVLFIGFDDGNSLLSTLKKPCTNYDYPFDEVQRGSELPGWFSLQITGSSSIFFEMPLLPTPDYVKEILVGVVFTALDGSSMQLPPSFTIIFSNKTNGLEWTHRSIIHFIPAVPEDYVLEICIPRVKIDNQIEGGDQLEASIIITPAIEVKKWGIHVVIDTKLPDIESNFVKYSIVRNYPLCDLPPNQWVHFSI